MSGSNNPDESRTGGYSLSGSGPVEPLPEEWRANISTRTSGNATRIGRIGGSSGTGGLGLGSLSGAGGADEDEEGPEGDERDEGENWYAGGERSGISVANPDRATRQGNSLVRDILRKAAEAGQAPQPPSAPRGPFSGNAYTLGSGQVESSFIPDPNVPQEAGEEQEVAIRHITFWREGFSVEDGPLLRYDEPANSQLLDEINSGHAPPQILNVMVGQPVELRVTRRLDEDYIPPPKRPVNAFEGQGHRLGAPTPDASSSSALDESNIPGAYPPRATQASQAPQAPQRENVRPHFEVDQTLPVTSVQVRLADGTRIVARMNLHHTVGDIRNFIDASRPNPSNAPYAIQTTFPNKVLEDNSQTIEGAGLKNSVIVQRFV